MSVASEEFTCKTDKFISASNQVVPPFPGRWYPLHRQVIPPSRWYLTPSVGDTPSPGRWYPPSPSRWYPLLHGRWQLSPQYPLPSPRQVDPPFPPLVGGTPLSAPRQVEPPFPLPPVGGTPFPPLVGGTPLSAPGRWNPPLLLPLGGTPSPRYPLPRQVVPLPPVGVPSHSLVGGTPLPPGRWYQPSPPVGCNPPSPDRW